MALPSTLFRFRIDLSDVDRGVYEYLDFRIAQHPSETSVYLVTRILAYALNFEEELKFSPGGLSEPDEPALLISEGGNSIKLWIEIGNPSSKKLHRAAKTAKTVRVYTYKDAELLITDLIANEVYHADRIEIFSFPKKFLDRLAETLVRDNKWNILLSDSSLTVSVGDISETIEIGIHSVKKIVKK